MSLDYRAVAAQKAARTTVATKRPDILQSADIRERRALAFISRSVAPVSDMSELTSGTVLCRLINTIWPSVARVSRQQNRVNVMKNIHAFVHACEEVGVPKKHLCGASDILRIKQDVDARRKVADLVLVLQEMNQEAVQDGKSAQMSKESPTTSPLAAKALLLSEKSQQIKETERPFQQRSIRSTLPDSIGPRGLPQQKRVKGSKDKSRAMSETAMSIRDSGDSIVTSVVSTPDSGTKATIRTVHKDDIDQRVSNVEQTTPQQPAKVTNPLVSHSRTRTHRFTGAPSTSLVKTTNPLVLKGRGSWSAGDSRMSQRQFVSVPSDSPPRQERLHLARRTWTSGEILACTPEKDRTSTSSSITIPECSEVELEGDGATVSKRGLDSKRRRRHAVSAVPPEASALVGRENEIKQMPPKTTLIDQQGLGSSSRENSSSAPGPIPLISVNPSVLSKAPTNPTVDLSSQPLRTSRRAVIKPLFAGFVVEDDKSRLEGGDSDDEYGGKDGIVMRGPLEKRGNWNTNFKWRYFELRRAGVHGHICYYEMLKGRGKAVAPLGLIALIAGHTEVQRGQDETIFRVHTPSRTYELRAADRETRAQWTRAIQRVIGKTKHDMSPKAKRMLLGSDNARPLSTRQTRVALAAVPAISHNTRQSSHHRFRSRPRESDFGGRRVGEVEAPTTPSEVLKEGFLDKRGEKGTRAFRNRFFQLLKRSRGFGLPSLTYCMPKLARTHNILGAIPLAASTCVVTPTVDKSLEFSLNVPGRRYELRAQTQSDRDEWVLAIGSALQQRFIAHKTVTGTTGDSEWTQELQGEQAEAHIGLAAPTSLKHKFSVSQAPSTTASSMQKLCEGYLEKRGGQKAQRPFRRRFFRLLVDSGDEPVGSLTYHTDNKTWEVLGSIEIKANWTLIAMDASCKEKRSFFVQNPDRKYVLRASANPDMLWWVRKLCQVLKRTLASTKQTGSGIKRSESNAYLPLDDKVVHRKVPSLSLSFLAEEDTQISPTAVLFDNPLHDKSV